MVAELKLSPDLVTQQWVHAWETVDDCLSDQFVVSGILFWANPLFSPLIMIRSHEFAGDSGQLTMYGR